MGTPVFCMSGGWRAAGAVKPGEEEPLIYLIEEVHVEKEKQHVVMVEQNAELDQVYVEPDGKDVEKYVLKTSAEVLEKNAEKYVFERVVG